ncbi:hypothetical protein [Streptomyces hiroshimensis]
MAASVAAARVGWQAVPRASPGAPWRRPPAFCSFLAHAASNWPKGASVICGDAEKGHADGAPYDRWLATFTVPEIPYVWVEQTPAGRIVAPWGSYHSYSFAVLDVRDGVAEGRFSGYPAFMRSRTNRPPRGYLSDFLHHQDEADRSTTTLSPRDLAAEYEAKFFIGLGLRDAWSLMAEANDGSDEAHPVGAG